MNTFILENINSIDTEHDTPSKEFNHIQKYYELKVDYYNFLTNKGSKKYTYNLPNFNKIKPFKTESLVSEKSNLPLKFTETRESLIITVMDHEQENPLKEISIKIKNDTKDDIESYNIKKELLLFKLNSIKSKKLTIDANKDRDIKKAELAKLSTEWDILKASIAAFQSKYSTYKIRKKLKENAYSAHYQTNIHTNALNNYNDIRTDLLIKHLASSTYNAESSIKYYVLLKFLSYLNPSVQTYPTERTDLCLMKMEDGTPSSNDSLIGELIYKKIDIIDITNIYVIIKRLSKKSIKVVNVEGEEFEFSNSEYSMVVDRVNIEPTLLKQLYEDPNIINMNQRADEPVCKIKEINPIPSSYSGLVYSGKSPIIYIPKSRLQGKKKKNNITVIQEVESIPKYKLLDKRSSFDSFISYTTDELFIYKGPNVTEPGNLFLNALTGSNSLKKEKCTDPEVKSGMKTFPSDWREILSIGNRYIHKSNGEVLPIIIDSMKFSSVSHYLLYNKYKGDDKSDSFLYGGVLGTSYVSIDEGLYEDYSISPDWDSVDDTLKIKKSSICLAKANCAKYIQFHEYKLILFATKDTKLIRPVNNNTTTGEYQIDKELIMVRTLLRNGDDPLFYMTWNDDFVKSVHIHKDIMSRIIMPDPSILPKKPKIDIKTPLGLNDPPSPTVTTSPASRESLGAVATKERGSSESSSNYTPPMSPLLTAAIAPTEVMSYPDTAFDYRNRYTIDNDAGSLKMLNSEDTFNFQFQTGTLLIDINNGGTSVTIDDFHNVGGGGKLTFSKLEDYHDYIQWLFPNSEKSRFNSDSRAFLRRGELAMLKTSTLAQDNMLKSFITMTKFYGGEVHFFESLVKAEEDRSATGAGAPVIREQVAVILPGIDIKGRLRNLNAHTHNQSRITRILKYLGEMGSEHLKIALIEFLIFHICHNPLRISWKDSFTKSGRNPAALVFWINTIYEDEERERLFNSFRMCYRRNRKIRRKLLKGLPKQVLSEWKVDEEGSYSQTSWAEAETITGLMVDTFRNMFRITRKLNIIDATASIGGNTISFLDSDDIQTVMAIEPDNTRLRYLDINIDTFLRSTWRPSRIENIKEKISIVNESFDAKHSIMTGEEIFGEGYVADIVFIDPPWGGVDYAMHHNPARFLGDEPLEEICSQLLYDTTVQLVVLKLPTNFLIEDFRLNLADQNILISQLEGKNINKMNIYIVYLDTVYTDDDDDEDLDEKKKRRKAIESKYQGGGRKKHSIKKHSTFPYRHGKHKYHMACRENQKTNSQDIVGLYNSKKGEILYTSECRKYEVLKTIMDALIQKCEKKEIDLTKIPMKKIPYVVDEGGNVLLGDNKVGRLIKEGRIEFL